MISEFFRLKENNTDVRTELIAGISTFLTMSYIIFVNPEILAQAGMDKSAVFVATCLASALATLAMGLVANYPIALAPGMGINAFFTYTVVQSMGVSWEVALGAVFYAGALFLLISVLPIREWIINSIPHSQKLAIAAGIGLFLAMIALQNMQFIVPHPATMLTLGNVTAPSMLMSFGCFLLIVALEARGIPGAIIGGILLTTLLGIALGVSAYQGIFSAPPSVSPIFLQLDLNNAFELGMLGIIMAFLMVHMFDTAGTLVTVAYNADLLDENGKLPRLNRALLADSTSMMAGSVIGTSPASSYVESVAGVKAGGRTGLTAVFVAILFIFSLFLAPLASTIPSYATAPALLFVACLMLRSIIDIDWNDITEFAPAVIVVVVMPLTLSITDGIGFGFISYAAIKLLTGRFDEVNAAVLTLALIFVLKYIFLEV